MQEKCAIELHWLHMTDEGMCSEVERLADVVVILIVLNRLLNDDEEELIQH